MDSIRISTFFRYRITHSILLSLTLSTLYTSCNNDRYSPYELDLGVKSSSDDWWLFDRFDDHTLTSIKNLDSFHRLAYQSEQMKILKFLLIEPLQGASHGWSEAAMSRFYDSQFYTLHDQLYWFRLLNGAPVWGFEQAPLTPPLDRATVATVIEEMNRWERTGISLPLDLRFTTDRRLYAPKFYEAILSSPRRAIAGSLIYLPPKVDRIRPEALWAFELEYSDQPTVQELHSLFKIFTQRLPSELSPLHWLIRSPFQAEQSQRLIERWPKFSHLILNYNDLITPGEAAVYSDGITAGRIHLMEDIHEETLERDLLIYNSLPDDLPTSRGLITAIPQTPLAHLNLLARNRGIPNIYVAQIDQNPSIRQLSRAKAPAILYGQSPNIWLLLPINNTEYERYLQLKSAPRRTISRPEIENTPYIIVPENLSIEDSFILRASIGGKATGAFMLKKIIQSDVRHQIDTPEPMLALTGRAYAEHMVSLEPIIRPLINDHAFVKDRLLLTLLLEGWAGVWFRSPSTRDIEKLRSWLSEQTAVIRELVTQGGVQNWIFRHPINEITLTQIRAVLATQFDRLSPYQGLRFRSSSNVEDLEGFNGAGLYGSFTAYLYPHLQETPKQRDKTVSKALVNVWASYWNLEAFEERELEGISHLEGWMGVLIHPHFQDEYELSNGVMTLTLYPDPPIKRGHNLDQTDRNNPQRVAKAVLNSQLGSDSVTNPRSPSQLTELIEVNIMGDLSEPHLDIERLQDSSLTGNVLSSPQIEVLIDHALTLTRQWREVDNVRFDPPQRYQALTIDFEYREVSPQWPLLRQAPLYDASRLILKQARPLEPSQSHLHANRESKSFPRDLIRRSLRLRRWSCEGNDISVSVLQLYTDPLSSPQMGFEHSPFTGEVRYTDHRQSAHRSGLSFLLTHHDYLVVDSSPYTDELKNQWRVRVYRRASRDLPFEYLNIDQQQQQIMWVPRNQDGEAEDTIINTVSCEVETLFASPNDYLSDLAHQAIDQGLGLGSHLLGRDFTP